MNWVVPLTEIAMPEEDVEAVLDCLRSGWLTMGPRTGEFERAFAEYVGIPHAVAVSSGTAALQLALLAAGVGPGDEVVVPALTFVATASTVRHVGATPVIADIGGPDDLNVDVESVRSSLTPRTRAVIAVHFMGYPADVLALRELCRERGLVLVEDVAQAVGASVDGQRTGTVGDLGCFSFFSKKQLCVGEGGMVVTTDEGLADGVRRLRSHAMTSGTWDRHHGYSETYDVVDIGFNYRLDEPRAALGTSRLRRLDDDIAARRAIVREYRRRLADVSELDIPWDDDAVERSSHFAFPILLADREARDLVRSRLRDAGVQTTWYPAITKLSAFRGQGDRSCRRAESIASRHCALPLSAALTTAQLDYAVNAVGDAVVGLRPSPAVR